MREPELLRTYAMRHDSGLHVLAAPITPEAAELDHARPRRAHPRDAARGLRVSRHRRRLDARRAGPERVRGGRDDHPAGLPGDLGAQVGPRACSTTSTRPARSGPSRRSCSTTCSRARSSSRATSRRRSGRRSRPTCRTTRSCTSRRSTRACRSSSARRARRRPTGWRELSAGVVRARCIGRAGPGAGAQGRAVRVRPAHLTDEPARTDSHARASTLTIAGMGWAVSRGVRSRRRLGVPCVRS